MGKYAKSRAKQCNRSKNFWKMVPENSLMEFLFVSLRQADQEVFWKQLIDGIATVSKEFRFGRWFGVSLCYLGAWVALIRFFVCVVLFLSPIFLFLAICHKLPCGGINKNRSFHPQPFTEAALGDQPLPARRYHSGPSNPENCVRVCALVSAGANAANTPSSQCAGLRRPTVPLD